MKAICNVEGCNRSVVARDMCEMHYRRFMKHGHINKTRVRKICSADGCENFVVSNGLCEKHRSRLRNNGTLENTRPEDWGKREKHPMYKLWTQKRRYNKKWPLADHLKGDFWTFVDQISERPSMDHQLRPINLDRHIDHDNHKWVLPQTKEIEKIYKPSRNRSERTLFNDWAYKLQKTYGITAAEYLSMDEEQGNKCALCGNPETYKDPRTKKVKRLAVDHCHETGKVRGLLCTSCNTALGKFKDSADILKKAIAYLEKRT